SRVDNKPRRLVMKTLIPAAIRCSLMFTAVIASLFCVQPAQAYKLTLRQVGANVVAHGSGAFNVTGLLGPGPNVGGNGQIVPIIGVIWTGSGLTDLYGLSLPVHGPSSFGAGRLTFASTNSGGLVGISSSSGFLFVPRGYISNTFLSASSS